MLVLNTVGKTPESERNFVQHLLDEDAGFTTKDSQKELKNLFSQGGKGQSWVFKGAENYANQCWFVRNYPTLIIWILKRKRVHLWVLSGGWYVCIIQPNGRHPWVIMGLYLKVLSDLYYAQDRIKMGPEPIVINGVTWDPYTWPDSWVGLGF